MRKPFPSGSRPSRPGARWDDGVGGPPVERARAAAERGPAVGGAPDPAVPPDDRGDRVTAGERRAGGRDPCRAGSLVDGGADLPPLGPARSVGAPAPAGTGVPWART